MAVEYQFKDIAEMAAHFKEKAIQHRSNAKHYTPKSQRYIMLTAEASTWESAAHILANSKFTGGNL